MRISCGRSSSGLTRTHATFVLQIASTESIHRVGVSHGVLSSDCAIDHAVQMRHLCVTACTQRNESDCCLEYLVVARAPEPHCLETLLPPPHPLGTLVWVMFEQPGRQCLAPWGNQGTQVVTFCSCLESGHMMTRMPPTLSSALALVQQLQQAYQ